MILNNDFTKSTVLAITFLFLIFPINFNLIPIDSSRVILWALVVFSIVSGTFFLFKHLVNPLTIFFSLVMFCYILMISFFRQNIEVTFILFYLEKFILLPVVIGWVVVFLANSSFDLVKKAILYALLFQCLVIVMNLLVPETKGWVASYAKLPGAAEMYPFRTLGITGFLSYSNGFLLFMAFYILEGTKSSYVKTFLQSATFLIAVAFSRSSIVIYAIYLCIRSFSDLLRMKLDKNILIFILALVLAITTFIFLFSSYISAAILEWIFDIFLSVFRGEIPSGISALDDQIWLPPDGTLIFGDARFKNEYGGYYENTDVGYMRYILYFGIIGLILHFVIIFSTFTSLFAGQNKRYKHLLITYLITLIILTYKGNFIMDTSGLLAMIFALNPRLGVQKK